MRYLIIAVFLVSMIGCRQTRLPETDQLRLTTESSTYTPGSEVQIRLENGTDRTVGYNLCYSSMERQADDDWERVVNADDVCTAILNTLESGGEASFEKTLPVDLTMGTYRFSTEVEIGGDGQRTTVTSEPFSVSM